MPIRINRRLILVLAGVVLLIAFWGGIKYSATRGEKPEGAKTSSGVVLQEKTTAAVKEGKSGPNGADGPDVQAIAAKKVKVYVSGAVNQPNIYEFPEGTRVYEAVAAAGPWEGADLAAVGMARKLQDGETLYVCMPGETPPAIAKASGDPGPSSSQPSSGPININTASADELDARLPGIGPALAGRIVDYRTNNGPFASIEKLKEVSGIGDKKYEGLKDLITVN